jgi:hypothetical protein
MTIFALNNESYKHPDTCEDVTIQQVIEYYRDVYPTRPSLMQEMQEAVEREPIDEKRVAAIEKKMQSKVWISSQLYPFMSRTVTHFCGAPEQVLTMTTPAHLEYLYGKCLDAMAMPRTDYKKLYMIDGEVYELPEKLMSNATLQEFAEAAQYEENAALAKDGNWEGMLNVAAVVLRKVGEEYSEEVYNRNRARFRTLPLLTLYEVAFFFQMLSARYALALQAYSFRAAVQDLAN